MDYPHNNAENAAIRKMPYSLDAERSVLGSLLLDNGYWEDIDGHLIDADFYHSKHRTIFTYIRRLMQENNPVDVVTLSDHLAMHQMLDQAGGFHYLAELAKDTPPALNIKAYADIVKEKSLLRSLLTTTTDIGSKVHNPEGRNALDLIDYAETQILSISEQRQHGGDGLVPISDVVQTMVERLEILGQNKGQLTGLDTGFHDLNEMTAGLHPSSLVIIAARPSMGKTVLGVNLAENVAKRVEKPVLIFSLEMPSHEIVMRMIASQGRIEMTKLRDGNLNDQDWSKAFAAMDLISGLPIHIDDTAALTPAEIRSRARRVYREHDGLSMILVDYLGLMKVPGYETNRNLEVSEISRSLKALAKELAVPVVALSQLNREVDSRADKRPINSDLRDSGSIEQDADVIMFIYRDEVYHKDRDDNKGLAEIIISKQRNGPTGTLKVSFQGQFASFADLAYPFQESNI